MLIVVRKLILSRPGFALPQTGVQNYKKVVHYKFFCIYLRPE